jgi:hypothetical protein
MSQSMIQSLKIEFRYSLQLPFEAPTRFNTFFASFLRPDRQAALRRRRSRSGTARLLPVPLRPLTLSLALPVTRVQAAGELRNPGPRPAWWLRHVLFDFDGY